MTILILKYTFIFINLFDFNLIMKISMIRLSELLNMIQLIKQFINQ